MHQQNNNTALYLVAWLFLIIILAIICSSHNSVNAVPVKNDIGRCIIYVPLTKTILVACDNSRSNNNNIAINLTDINDVLNNNKILHKEDSQHKVWLLNANLAIEKGTEFYINSTDTDWLKINSTGGNAYRIESRHGNLIIDNVKITSWNTNKNDYTKSNSSGTLPRGYILVNNGNTNNSNTGSKGTTHISNSEIAFLGYNYPSAFGLTYYGGAGSVIKNNKIHDLWYGFYSHTNNAHNITIKENKFYNNIFYGIDQHNGAHNVIVRNNLVYNNGKHGIIYSDDCHNIVIESNRVFNNSQNGIVLHRNVFNSMVKNNAVYDNVNDQISLNYAHDNQIDGNNITRGKFGIRVGNQSSNTYIYNNSITNPSQYGIYLLDGAAKNYVASNKIVKATIYALHVQGPKTNNNIFRNNYLLENKQDAIRLYNLGNKSHAFFIANTVRNTTGYEYSLTKSILDLVDTPIDAAAIKPATRSEEDKIILTYSYRYVLENIVEKIMMHLKENPWIIPDQLLLSFDTTESLFIIDPEGYFLGVEYSIPHNASLVQYRQGPVINNDPNLNIEKVLDGGIKFPTAMSFLGPNDILVLEKNTGTVQRIVNGKILAHSLLDVNVANKAERGMLGLAVAKNTINQKTYVFLYYTESASKKDGDDECPIPNDVCKPGHNPIGNRIYRYELQQGGGDKLVNPKLLLDLPAIPGPVHNGGKIILGPDNNLYITIGDLNGHKTQAENFKNESAPPDGTGGILRITQNGEPVHDNPFVNSSKGLHSLAKYYYAYGIRNSFGLDFDPLTAKLWDTENGPNFGDEINLVELGFNSGWSQVQGIWKPNRELRGNIIATFDHKNETAIGLIDFNGKGVYHNPQFIWEYSTGLTAVKFLKSDKLGKDYKNDMFVGDFHTGSIFHFGLNSNRTGIAFPDDHLLADKIANNPDEIRDVIFAHGFGGVTDIEVNPYDGYLYVLALHKGGGNCDVRFPNKPCMSFDSPVEGTIFRIVPVIR